MYGICEPPEFNPIREVEKAGYCSKCHREPDGCICGSSKRTTTAHEPDFKGIEAHVLKRQLVQILKNLRGSKKMKKTDNMSVEGVLNLIMLESSRVAERLANKEKESDGLHGEVVALEDHNDLLNTHFDNLFVLSGGPRHSCHPSTYKYEMIKRVLIAADYRSKGKMTEYDRKDLEKSLRLIHRKMHGDILDEQHDKTPLEEVLEDIHSKLNGLGHAKTVREELQGYLRELCIFATGLSANGTWKQQYESIREKMEDMERELKANSEESDSFETVVDYLCSLYLIATGEPADDDCTSEDMYETIKQSLDRSMRQSARLDAPGKRDTAMILAEQLDRSDKEVKRLQIELGNREEHIEKLTTAIGYAVDPSEELEDLVAAAVEDAEETNKRESELEEYGHELHGYLDELYRMTTDDYEDLGMSEKAMFEAIQKHIKYYEDPGLKPTDDEEREKRIYLLERQVDKFRNEAMYLRNRLEEIHDIVLPDGDKGLPDDSIANVIIGRVRYLMHPRNAAEWERIADFRRTQLEVMFKKLLRTNPTGLSDDDLSQDIIDKIDALLEPQPVQIKGTTAKEEWSIPKKAQETLDWLTASLREIHSKLTGLPEGAQTQLLMRQAVSEINAEIDRLTHPQVRIQDLSASEEVERRLRDDIHDIYCITMGLQPDAVTAKITTQDAVKDIKKEAERKNIELKDYRAHIHRLCEAAGFKIDGCVDDFVTAAVEEIEDLQNTYDTEWLRDSFQEIYEMLYNRPSDDDDTTTFRAITARIRSLQMDRVHGTKVGTYPEDDPAEQAMMLAEKWCAQALEREITIGVVRKKLKEVMKNLIAKKDSPNSLLLEQIINFSEPREE